LDEVPNQTRPTSAADPTNPHATVTAQALRHALGEQPGDLIGPYRLLQLLGEGGFGFVFLAERRDPFVQRVALKVVKPGMDSRAVLSRFEQERQALAVMDHPNVARVFDAGTTASGRPYFVMEHVGGEPITTYCDRHKLTIRQRLELFIPVCDAVQHAHHKGIIHRDLKPSNILVFIRDDAPVPKVIDFGVAKAISHTLTDKTIFTETGQLIGTPEYMSPEQAEMGATDIDTRSDVYSLGAVLYELLSGTLPFDPAQLRSGGYNHIQQVIREIDPPKPSTRLTSLGAAAADDVARVRRAQRAALAAELRHELDWIPLKALRKDRTERYNSPADLVRDIRNYLDGRPLEAGPESAAYRFRKIVRRNKGPVFAASLVLAALLLGLAGTGWGLVTARRHASEAIAAEERSEAILGLLQSALRQNRPPSEAMFTSDEGENLFEGRPEVEAELRLSVAEILNNNGHSTEALQVAQRALNILRGQHPGDNRAVALAMNQVALALQESDRPDEAEPMFRETLAMLRRLAPGDDAEVAKVMNNLAGSLYKQGRLADAKQLFQESLAMRQRLYPGDNAEVASGLNNLALAERDLGELTDAEALFRQSLAMHQRLFPHDHPRVAQALNNLGFVLQSLHRPGEAEPRFREAVEMNRRLFAGDNPDTARYINNLAFVLNETDRPGQAEPLFREAAAMQQRLLGDDSPEVANTLKNLARCLEKLDRIPEAVDAATRAVTICATLPPDHPIRQKCETLLAHLKSKSKGTGP
jgi:serine/threonine protein kinase/Tfp pilus assembly protein PilF